MRKVILFLVLLLSSIVALAVQTNAYGPTTKADELWQIAILVRPNANVTVVTMMDALKKANPNAFAADDKLKVGVMLNVPVVAEVKNSSVVIAPKKEPVPEQIAEPKSDNIGPVMLKFDEHYQAQLAELKAANLGLQKNLIYLNMQIQVQNDQIKAFREQSDWQRFYFSYARYIKRMPLNYYYVILGIFCLSFIAMYLRGFVMNRQLAKINLEDEEDTEAEYDFMGSSEGIPAKLDLAQAYIDMDDKLQARKVLNEIVKHGNKEQQERAREMLAVCE